MYKNSKLIKIENLGKTQYLEALGIQVRIFNEKINGIESDDYILITEHYPVYTCGKTTKKEHILNTGNIPIFEIERGGSITFHGEGQIVIYPVLDLKHFNLSVKKFVFLLEEAIIRTLKEYSIPAFRIEGKRGVFTDKGKIGFIGIRVSKNVSMHGISLNVNVDKTFFENIVPCGLYDIPVCNMKDFNREIKRKEVEKTLVENLVDLLNPLSQ